MQTERLILRPITEDDVTAVLDGRHLADWAPDFPAEGDREIAGLLARTGVPDEPFVHRLVVERDSGLVVGGVGLFGPPDQDGSVEIGYGIVPSRRGRGYASEATRAMVRFALAQPEVRRVVAAAQEANPASVHVLRATGSCEIGRSEGTIRVAWNRPGSW